MTIEMSRQKGFFSALRLRLERNRLGDLLVGSGAITPDQLRTALIYQKQSGKVLGVVLREQGLLSTMDLRLTLAQQFGWRALGAAIAFMIGFSALGIHSARATSAQSSEISYARRSVSEKDIQPISLNRNIAVPTTRAYPTLFGTRESRSADISPFTKWTDVVARLSSANTKLPAEIAAQAGASELKKIETVNSYYNRVRYIEDKNNWGKSDYWETPEEFARRGGDCEDFAIAKYAALKELGFKESQLRLAIVQDTWKGLPHAILIVYTNDGAKFLDNQYKEVKDVDGFERYRPVYSINRTGWWRHLS